MQNDKGVEINQRFFYALDKLVSEGSLKSARAFCMENDYLVTNLSRLRKEPSREFPLHLLEALVKDYGVSGDWLLTGKGHIIKKSLYM
ncbi:hypothetical protein [Parapedobacter indicus]|uniref:Bacteriophage CI repressor helix-turn-helix domain-containing protein n=1 Tax=Parapedobacter indicus TaxID=1477437 RepID=A0A1I3DZI8_9SPHI|nr:hypothetical protein [Parapedobacter indicus]PPL04904.1 hypothetical protein CLV26_101714 [Parapedobacter indicus]SFH92063.1 hypothetical protein SAMN05444682_101700 [Parapedobacter indicus]